MQNLEQTVSEQPEFRPVRKQNRWTKEEDDALAEAIKEFKGRNWRLVAERIPGRSSVQCIHRWNKIAAPGLKKGQWDKDEDQKLLEWVKKFGTSNWGEAPTYIQGRSCKQCRERWVNVLNPEICHDKWTPEEDKKIFQCFHTYGAQWTTIASHFPGRTENSVKNRFYTCKRSMTYHRKKLENSAKILEMTKNLSSTKEFKDVHPNANPQNLLRLHTLPILTHLT